MTGFINHFGRNTVDSAYVPLAGLVAVDQTEVSRRGTNDRATAGGGRSGPAEAADCAAIAGIPAPPAISRRASSPRTDRLPAYPGVSGASATIIAPAA